MKKQKSHNLFAVLTLNTVLCMVHTGTCVLSGCGTHGPHPVKIITLDIWPGTHVHIKVAATWDCPTRTRKYADIINRNVTGVTTANHTFKYSLQASNILLLHCDLSLKSVTSENWLSVMYQIDCYDETLCADIKFREERNDFKKKST